MDSYLEIVKLEVKEEFFAAYHTVRKLALPNFSELMQTLADDIYALQNDCDPPVNPIESALLMCMNDLSTDGTCTREEQKELDKFIKAAAVWMIIKEYPTCHTR
jgi:hypothetical protein